MKILVQLCCAAGPVAGSPCVFFHSSSQDPFSVVTVQHCLSGVILIDACCLKAIAEDAPFHSQRLRLDGKLLPRSVDKELRLGAWPKSPREVSGRFYSGSDWLQSLNPLLFAVRLRCVGG